MPSNALAGSSREDIDIEGAPFVSNDSASRGAVPVGTPLQELLARKGGAHAKYNLLADPVLSIAGFADKMSLADLLSALFAQAPGISFNGMRQTQRAHWWRFLTRTGAYVAFRLGIDPDTIPDGVQITPQAIREVLLTDTTPEAWCLYQPDTSKPGFLQIPLSPEQTRPKALNIDAIARLHACVQTANHARKTLVPHTMSPEETIYALIEYQVGSPQGGRGNYGSAPMGSVRGQGSGMPYIGIIVDHDIAKTFCHDVTTWLERRDDILALGVQGSIWAMWTLPWNGDDQISSDRLDPYWIPYSRIVRLSLDDSVFRESFRMATKAARVLDHSGGGNLGDIFLPIIQKKTPSKETLKVRGTMPSGYDYRETARILGVGGGGTPEPITPPPSVTSALDRLMKGAALPTSTEALLEGVAYKGTEEIFYSRTVAVPPDEIGWMTSREIRDISAHMTASTVKAQKVLKEALIKLQQGDTVFSRRPIPHGVDYDYTEAVSIVFFPHLFGALAQIAKGDIDMSPNSTWATQWHAVLREIARAIFRQYKGAVSGHVTTQYQAEVAAESHLYWGLAEEYFATDTTDATTRLSEEAESLGDEAETTEEDA